jgi:hypothetical protein
VRGNQISNMVHVEEIKKGDSYLIVWPNADEPSQPIWRMQRADTCGMVYHDETAEPLYAFKLWSVDSGPYRGHLRLTIYAADEITRYVTSRKTDTEFMLRDGVKADHFIEYSDELGESRVVNDFETLPVFHFRCNPEHQTAYGRSALADVVGLQDAANYALWSLMVGMEFTAWPQKVAVGVERLGDDDESVDVGVDKWLTVGSALANLYTIPGAPLDPFNSTIDEIDALISRSSRVPVHWLGLVSVSNNISGETVKALEAPFSSMLVDRQNGNDDSWSGAMVLDQRIRHGGAEDIAKIGTLMPIWKSPETRSDMETWSIAQLKKNAGVPESQIWKEGGYSAEQVQAFEEENKRKADEAMERLATQFAGGENTGFGDTDADGE